MKISEAEKETGLTAKAIRLYEEKGLISVERRDNSYREYSREDVNKLKQVKMFRELGIGISEISLFFNGVVSFQELVGRRKETLEKETKSNNESYKKCLKLLEELYKHEDTHSVKGEIKVISIAKSILGIDIGTTTISAVVIDIEKNQILETYTIANDSRLKSDSDMSEYDADWILDKVKKIADYLVFAYPNIKSIGVTGQMHGIVYIDEDGNAISPLYNWQDGRANRRMKTGRTYCEEIYERTGQIVYSGYGFATLFYNKCNGLEPPHAKSFCTIMDYVTMKLSENKKAFVHPSNAASFGLYDEARGCFDCEAVKKLGLRTELLPHIASDNENIKAFKKAALSSAIGDNQASFYASVKKEKTSVLVNFGTGSQISVMTQHPQKVKDNLEIRPYLFGKYLICGSALCGGKAYSILEKFFSSYAKQIKPESGEQYELMNEMAMEAYGKKNSLTVNTQFCGTRKNHDILGSIMGISDENFTPENLTLALLNGMVNELKGYFECMKAEDINEVIASGNAVQKNKVLQLILKDTFGKPSFIMQNKEEAAIGAALYSAVKNNVISNAQRENIIIYKEIIYDKNRKEE